MLHRTVASTIVGKQWVLWDWGQGRERSPVAVLSQSSARDNSTRTGERYARVVPIHSSYVRLVVFSASARLSEADLCEILQRTTDLLASHRCERGCVTVDINCDLSNSCTLEVDCQLRLSGALNDPLKPDRPADHAKSSACQQPLSAELCGGLLYGNGKRKNAGTQGG
jgi:hypothetical protein